MGVDGGTEGNGGASRVDRRKLLKGAAAVGVGVAAWSTPSITSLGGTPVYAAQCTGPITNYFLGQRNTSCDCNGFSISGDTSSPVYKFVQYKWPFTGDCGQTVYDSNPSAPGTQPAGPRVPTFNFGNNGECPPDTWKGNSPPPNGIAAVTIPGGSDWCVITVKVLLNNCGSSVLATATTGLVGGTAKTVAMPRVLCASTGPTPSSIFLQMFLTCAEDDACLTDAY